MQDKISISELWIYPIKGCAGLKVDRISIDTNGIAFDRKWQIVDALTMKFITQRELPKLATILTGLHGSSEDFVNRLSISVRDIKNATVQTISVSMINERSQQQPPLQPPLRSLKGDSETQPPATRGLQNIITETWGDKINAFDTGDEAAEFLSSYLERPVRLVQMPQTSDRPVASKYTTRKKFSGKLAFGFADSTPISFVSAVSQKNITSEFIPFETERFRMNVILDGVLNAQDENQWREFKINESQFGFARHCTRCPVIDVDQKTGLRTPGLLKHLVQTHLIDGKPVMGINCYLDPADRADELPAELCVGDVLTVLKRET
jgi:uncharacterized protein